MLEIVLLLIANIISVEILLRIKFKSYLFLIIHHFSKTFLLFKSSKISDHWKEKILPQYAIIILRNSLLALGILSAIILLVLFLALLSNNFIGLLLSAKGLILSISILFFYSKFRQFK
jgi:hypothetical protein